MTVQANEATEGSALVIHAGWCHIETLCLLQLFYLIVNIWHLHRDTTTNLLLG